jgi:hypothetical protein
MIAPAFACHLAGPAVAPRSFIDLSNQTVLHEGPSRMQTIARMLVVGLLAGLGFVLVGGAGPTARRAPPAHVPAGRVVYLAGRLSDEALVALGAAVASRPGAVLLLDSRPQSRYLKHFLSAYHPEHVVAVGGFDEDAAGLSRRLGVAVGPVLPWPDDGPPLEVWAHLFERVDRVVVCPAGSRELLLQSACLAGAVAAPLWVVRDDGDALRRCLGEWKTREVFLTGAATVRLEAPGRKVRKLPTAGAVQAACVRRLAARGRVDRAVVVNPADTGKGLGGMSALGPWLATRKQAVLLCSGAGTDVAHIVKEASNRRHLSRLDTLILLANLKAIAMQQRPNPIPADRDKQIELEPLTPSKGEPFSYAVGRLFHDDRAVVPLMLARQRLMAGQSGPRKALVASNPGGGLNLLETLSRNTAQELRNTGWDVAALYGNDVTAAVLRRQMVGPDLFLWEGHHNTLIKEWGFSTWDEAMPPTFVFLQSCLALMDYKVQPLLARGAVGVLGTSTRTYSGSGGAFSLAFINGLTYEDRPLGDSLRQAKNFLLAYALLKQKRLGGQAVRTGANHRAAWSFTLWGDPTFRLPQPPRPDAALPPLHHEVTGNTIVLDLPEQWHGKVKCSRYEVQMPPGARLAGLVRKSRPEKPYPLVPLLFAEVHLPRARAGLTPRLRSRVPARQWVFVWDERRRTGYLLVMAPRPAAGELRFHVDWTGASMAVRQETQGSGS